MRAVVTRVCSASVAIYGEMVAEIASGLLVLLGAEAGDTEEDVRYIVDKTLHLRIFEDHAGKMNLSVEETGGQILVVSQFTLLGDARKGRRPGFSAAGDPQAAKQRYEEVIAGLSTSGLTIQSGRFGAHMDVASVNQGPVTILLDSRKLF